MDYEKIKQLIESHPDVVEFADFGTGVSEHWIEKTETYLGVRLPRSYKWWVQNYNGGEIGGEEIFSIYCQEPELIEGGDLVNMFRVYDLAGGKIPICHSDIDGLFCLDPNKKTGPEEYAVVLVSMQDFYADNFLEFLRKRIEICA